MSAAGVNAGSKFGMNFLGDRMEAGDIRAIALGGDFQVVRDSLGVLQRNPALLSFLDRVTLGAAQLVASDRGKSGGVSETDVSVKYPTFVLGVPLHEGLVISIGYRGRFDPDASFALEGVSLSGHAYTREFTKSGGLYSIPLTVAFAPTRFIALGFTYSLDRGSIEDRWVTTFDEAGFAPGVGFRRVEFSGSRVGGGVVLLPRGPVTLSFDYEAGFDCDLDIMERYTVGSIDTSYGGRAGFPASFSGALNWRVTSSWSLLLGAAASDFSLFEGLSFPVQRLHREERYALGVEYGAGKRLPLRFSLSYGRLPYDFPAGEKIETFSAGLGSGLILGDGKGKIDFALRVGRTGSSDKNGLVNNFIRFYVGVSGSEAWKRHRVQM
jgi:hypothetical protein